MSQSQTIEHVLRFDATGSVSFVWDDDLADLKEHGAVSIRRASHVEPDENGDWIVDLAPVGGPTLGPFDLRAEALAAEREWLRWHLWGSGIRDGGRSDDCPRD